MSKFSDGSASSYAELPVKVAYLRWTRGNAQLRSLSQADPAQFFGGWRANVTDKDGNANPELPLPVVERVSQDGKHVYKAYASNVIEFLPIQHRTRFELREKTTDPLTGRDVVKIKATSKTKLQGYTPVRQVFGLVFIGDKSAPAVLYIDKWSAFISFERAGQKWGKVKEPSGKALVRRYGTVGKDNLPVFEVYGQSQSTPIEAIGTDHPRFVDITPELDALYEQSLAWKDCPRWNAEDNEVNETIGGDPALKAFAERAKELGLTNVDTEQIVKEHNGDYAAALASIEEGALMDANAQLSELDDNPF
jgi:hypothetical protein